MERNMITPLQCNTSQSFGAKTPKGLSKRELSRIITDVNIATIVSEPQKQQKFTDGIVNRIRCGKLDADSVISQLKVVERLTKVKPIFFTTFAPKVRKIVEHSKTLPPIEPVTFKDVAATLKKAPSLVKDKATQIAQSGIQLISNAKAKAVETFFKLKSVFKA